jgi:hypothetical protein
MGSQPIKEIQRARKRIGFLRPVFSDKNPKTGPPRAQEMRRMDISEALLTGER